MNLALIGDLLNGVVIMDRRMFLAIGAKSAATAAVVLAAAGSPAQGMDQAGIAVKMLALVNEARAQGRRCGATFYPPTAPVRWNEVLARAARSHSEDMAGSNHFGHNSRDGTPPHVRVERAGYNYGGTAENIANGQTTPEAAMTAWLASPGHCANLMSAEYTEMGVGMAGNRWTLVFANPMSDRSRPTKARR